MKQHIAAMHEKSTRKYCCESCNITFSIKSNLKRHMTAIHKKF